MALKEVGREGGAWGSRGGPGPRVIGGSRFTGGASVFFKYHTSLLFTIGGERALDGLAERDVRG